MEVHTHSHTARKKWTHYLWEFLMLFLAVFCGFLAEYKLEQTIEHHKEKEYIESMMEDLQNDTTKLSQLNSGLAKIENSIDTILMYYDDMPKGANPILFRNINAIYGFSIFIYSDRTIQQLKSSGGMRLIKNKKAANGIMDYDGYVRNYENNGLYVQRYWENLTFQRINIIDQQALDNDLKTAGEINTEKNYLLVNDPVILRKLKSSIYELKIYHSHTIQDNIELKEKAMGLIQILKKEYHLK
jgi:hypothetical protein